VGRRQDGITARLLKSEPRDRCVAARSDVFGGFLRPQTACSFRASDRAEQAVDRTILGGSLAARSSADVSIGSRAADRPWRKPPRFCTAAHRVRFVNSNSLKSV
jgi:hypothetical protein